MTENKAEELEKVWTGIKTAGGRVAFVERQLEELGLAVERKPTDGMSKKQLGAYKRALKAEAAKRSELMRVSWEAHFAHHVVHVGEGIYWNDEDDWDKYDHPRAEERIAQNELPRLDSPAALAEALGITIPELRWLTYHREAATSIHYDRFTIPKNNGSGERAIWAPKPKLKAAQRWILREIAERLPVHGAAHGFVAGRSIYTNAARHTDSKIVVKMDLKDFFPSVTFPRVKGVFRKAGYREQVATLLALICTEPPREVVTHGGQTYFVAMGPRCLPQGAPTSPAITNALALRLDRRLDGLAKHLGWRYTSYADDLTFSLPSGHEGEERLGSLLGGVKAIVSAEGFTLHPDKTRVMRSGRRQQVTGMIVNGPGTPRVPREIRRRARAVAHNVQAGKPIKAGESLQTWLGYAAYIYMTDRELGAELIKQLG